MTTGTEPRTYCERADALLARINDRLDSRAWTAQAFYEDAPPFQPRTERERELLDTYNRLCEMLAPDDGE